MVVLSKFYDDVLKGNQVKELVKVLLEKSGYSVYPYGYESTLSDVKKKLREKSAKRSKTARRIRTSPDLLVYDGDRKDVMLVEVKMRRTPKETSLKYLRIANYKEFWDDSILVVVVPVADIFYAQRMSELEVRQNYNATTDFERFEDIFTRVRSEDLRHYRDEALKIIAK